MLKNLSFKLFLWNCYFSIV